MGDALDGLMQTLQAPDRRAGGVLPPPRSRLNSAAPAMANPGLHSCFGGALGGRGSSASCCGPSRAMIGSGGGVGAGHMPSRPIGSGAGIGGGYGGNLGTGYGGGLGMNGGLGANIGSSAAGCALGGFGRPAVAGGAVADRGYGGMPSRFGGRGNAPLSNVAPAAAQQTAAAAPAAGYRHPGSAGMARHGSAGVARHGSAGVARHVNLSVAGTAAGGAAAAPSAAPIALSHGFAADQNARFRKYMEDEHTAVHDFADRRGALYAGLYDGHGGRTAVDFVKGHLHAAVERELRSGHASESPLEAMRRAFGKVDRMLLQIGALHCGTTAAVCLCLPGGAPGGPPEGVWELHLANCGDSRAILVADVGPPKRLSVDHVATDPDEQERVRQAGGTVSAGRVGGSLAVSRAFGDHVLKGDDGGVTADPHAVTRRLQPADRFVLMASDGVWDVMSDEDASELVLSKASLSNNELADAVVQAALARGTRDNVSALVVRLR